MHPQSLREQVKADYLSGDFSSVEALSKHHKLSPDTVWKWYRADNWRDLRQLAAERRAERIVENVVDKMGEVDTKHYRAFDAILGLLLQKVKLGKENKSGFTAKEIALLARSMGHIQKGQRVATGLDQIQPDDPIIQVLLPDFEAEIKNAMDQDLLRHARSDEELERIEARALAQREKKHPPPENGSALPLAQDSKLE